MRLTSPAAHPVVRTLLLTLLALGLVLAAPPVPPTEAATADDGAAATAASDSDPKPLDPECPVYLGKPVPEGFAGCAELEAEIRDTQAFFNADGGFRLDVYEAELHAFFGKMCHRNPATGWVADKRVRDTGPYVGTLDDGQFTDVAYHGTHMPVVIWYDRVMMEWLEENRPHGAATAGDGTGAEPPPIPDGAMMVKEMFPAPATRCSQYDPRTLEPDPGIGVALMIRDNQGAHDGWFWGVWWPAFNPDWPAGAEKDNRLPYMGFGAYCLNCHASAVDNQTFADLKNIEGHPGVPNAYLSQSFLFQDSLVVHRKPPKTEGHHQAVLDTSDDPTTTDDPLPTPNPAFVARFPVPGGPNDPDPSWMMPSQTYDNVWVPGGTPPGPDQGSGMALGQASGQAPGAASEFVTSDQCLGCHDAGSTGLQFDMTSPAPELGVLLNLSPYGSWRRSPMGLGGRDPIFFAQLASETQTFHPDQKELVPDICLGCHGVLGQRQYGIDTFEASGDCDRFTREQVNAVPYPSTAAHNPTLANAPYGALARDGISCTACHRMALGEEEIAKIAGEPQNVCGEERQKLLNPDNTGFAATFTGSFFVGSPDELIGPFDDPKQKPMDHAMGILPVANQTIKSSEICGSCHTVHLPVYDGERMLGRVYEQTTYPEWAFSAYRTGETPDGPLPGGAGSLAQSCQQCHMQSAGPDGKPFRTKIASIQEYSTFPATDNALPPEEIDLEVREGFAIHTLVGLNVFFIEMAQQFPDILGIPTQDPMLGGNGLDSVLFSEKAMLDQASHTTATVAVSKIALTAKGLEARVEVESQVGHKLPSGVGFRRAFLELEVLDAAGGVLWASGRTDGAGTIVDQHGTPVAGELWWTADCSARLPGTPHQPHYQEITAQNQVQIYQELVSAPAPVAHPKCGHYPTPGGQLTTSFLSICGHVKDNRILPEGFLGLEQRIAISRALGAGDELGEATGPVAVEGDPDYLHGGGDSLVYRIARGEIAGEPAFVRATLFYQAIPPFYLQDRFCTAKGADTDRLYFLGSHLDLDGRSKDWKLEVVGSGLVAIPGVAPPAATAP